MKSLFLTEQFKAQTNMCALNLQIGFFQETLVHH